MILYFNISLRIKLINNLFKKVPFSPPDKKLVTIDNFSEVVYLLSIAERLTDHGSTNSSAVSFDFLPAGATLE